MGACNAGEDYAELPPVLFRLRSKAFLEEVSALKIRIQFAKYGKMIYIGHLDISALFSEGASPCRYVDLAYTQGYNPHPILSFAAPLGVGITSCGEYADLRLIQAVPLRKCWRVSMKSWFLEWRLLTIVYCQMMQKKRDELCGCCRLLPDISRETHTA